MHTINAGGEFCAFWVNCAKPESTRSVMCRAQIFSVALTAGSYVPAGPITFS